MMSRIRHVQGIVAVRDRLSYPDAYAYLNADSSAFSPTFGSSMPW